MAKCMKPFTTKQGINVPCGQCYDCRNRRVSGWAFRIEQEAKHSESALFTTLTYNTDTVPITKNGFMSLDKKDVQKFMKRLRKKTKNTIKYYAAGEYGENKKRPHYHIIILNSYEEDIRESWINVETNEPAGEVHIAPINNARIKYTLKYMCKGKTVGLFERDDRKAEFSLMSKGMGKQYINEKMKKWHQADLTGRYYLPEKDGYKIAMPRYYKEKLYTKEQREIVGNAMLDKETQEFIKLSYQQAEQQLRNNQQTCNYKERVKNKDTRNKSSEL